MNKEIEEVIRRIYFNKDFSFFIEQSKKCLKFKDDIIMLAKPSCNTVNYYEGINEPSVEIYFMFEEFIENKLIISYQTVLRISKITKVFSFRHEFSLDNPDKNRTTPVLDGCGDEAYIKSQIILENSITEYLMEQCYQKLSGAQMEEVICEIQMPENNLFGKQMTIDTALFRDVFDIFDEE